MRRLWLAVAALAWLGMAVEAHADTVYLKDGRRVWGKETYEEGDTIVVVRPGGDLRFPKSDVGRIETMRSTLPPFYSTPTGESAAPGAPATGPAGAPGAPAAPGGAPAPGTAPTALPPPPAPPPPGAMTPRY
jgi:hypothetical protein